jgi:hypothetical protein
MVASDFWKRGASVNVKQLAAFTGLGLIVCGLALITAQILARDYFAQMYKDFSAGGWQIHTNVVGFAVLLVGAALLAVASLNSPSNPN